MANAVQRTGETGANLGFEAKLWQTADALRGSMDAAEYKHVVLGLIFLKYISDAFEEHHTKLEAERTKGADPEDPDEYRALNIFWVPPEARWSHLNPQAKQPKIGELVDNAMTLIERDNTSLKGVLPRDYARPALDKQRLGQLIDLISNIKVGDKEGRSKDVLGRVYEYFLSQFASAEGKKGGEFYTPRCVVKLLVEMLEPYKGRVYDPCCGSSGMFVQSEEFIAAHGGKLGDISIYGQESNYTTWRLARMNLAIRGIDGQIAHGDTFHSDRHPDLKADYVLANPPFNVSDWGGERLRDDMRWQYGTPSPSNANFAWVQHIVYHLSPAGHTGFVLANGSMSSNQSGEGEIRKRLDGHAFAAITAGLRHTCALDTDGAAWCWGDNTYGELGDGTHTLSPTPMAVAGRLQFVYLKAGELSTCGVTPTGIAYCWGDNEYGQLGDGTATSSSVPVKVAFQP